MNKRFVQDWLNKLKKYWLNKDIEKAVLPIVCLKLSIK